MGIFGIRKINVLEILLLIVAQLGPIDNFLRKDAFNGPNLARSQGQIQLE